MFYYLTGGKKRHGSNAVIIIAAVVTVVVISTFVVLALLFRQRRKIKNENYKIITTIKSELNDLKNIQRDEFLQKERFDPGTYFDTRANLLGNDTKREIPRSLITVQELLGSGNFGTVSKGELIGVYGSGSKTTVAIKSTNGRAEGAELRDFLQEIKIMSNTKPHMNLVSMIGSCSSDIDNEKEVLLIIEFCQIGDMKGFLIENKKKILKSATIDAVDDKCLVHWAYDVSKGMEFLSSQNIMHGDLAARNVMLDENPVQFARPIAKIADFGLSKRFYNKKEQYEKESRLLVPWKWMAYEYLTCDYFTMTSDVWSFGIVLWEIFSFGRMPYGPQEYDDVVKQLERGYRLPCPTDVKSISQWNPENLYEDLSKLCFNEDPNERGTFSQVVSAIENHLSQEELSFYKEMEEKYKSERSNYYMQIGKNMK